MTLDSGLLWAFFLVFVRCTALMLSSPIFGSQTTPVHIRVMTTLALSGALVFALHPVPPHLPTNLGEMLLSVGNEAACGLLLGAFVSMTMMAVQFAGSFLDLHVGLGMSQVMNPVTGVPSSVITQFKAMLALIVFIGIQGHQFVIQAFVKSYETMPTLSLATMGPLQDGLIGLVGEMSILALQIAAPVAAVGLIVDTAMGIVNRAVPQMPVFLVGLPVKIGASMLALSLALPALVVGVQSGLDATAEALAKSMRKPAIIAPGGP
ncbi:MAG TPA: flagellar biosynthetic protein FliR [Fimbriimonadaceae bacterium]|nr:flagellar biosynthetic protein FliR [Fimbriimonadaceae bacterium]